MRLTAFGLSLIMLATVSGHCNAEDMTKTFFFASKNGEKAQTRNTETGVVMVVRQAEFGGPPKDCPILAFWELNENTLVDCTTGKQFQLTETEASKQLGASVQLHLTAPATKDRPFKQENWHIERAILLGPSTAILARAENDDYANKVFYPETPVRVLQGKAMGKPQRFALEFFIKFKGNDRGQKAIFNVATADTTNLRRYNTKVWATVPVDAE